MTGRYGTTKSPERENVWPSSLLRRDQSAVLEHPPKFEIAGVNTDGYCSINGDRASRQVAIARVLGGWHVAAISCGAPDCKRSLTIAEGESASPDRTTS